MSELDTAIRKAIERAGVRDAAGRRRIYDSARAALEKGIARHPELDAVTADEQRRRFETLVLRIEAEEAAGAAEPVEALAIEPASLSHPAEKAAAALPVLTATRDDQEPAGGGIESPAGQRRAERRARKAARVRKAPADRGGAEPAGARRKEGRGRLLSALFLLVSLAVFALLGLWLLQRTGLLEEASPVAGGPNSFTKFDSAANGGVPDLVTGDGFVGAWKPIFRPGTGDNVATGADASMAMVTSERGKALRLTSASNRPSGDIRIAIPPATLDAMAGRHATVALNVRAVAGHGTQIAVECSLPTLGGCGRHRFDVHGEMTDVVFDVDFSNAAHTSRPGYLILNTDIEGKARPIDLFAAGVRAAKGQHGG